MVKAGTSTAGARGVIASTDAGEAILATGLSAEAEAWLVNCILAVFGKHADSASQAPGR